MQAQATSSETCSWVPSTSLPSIRNDAKGMTSMRSRLHDYSSLPVGSISTKAPMIASRGMFEAQANLSKQPIRDRGPHRAKTYIYIYIHIYIYPCEHIYIYMRYAHPYVHAYR